MTIALSGFMGSGKSTVASLLAAKTGCFFFDLDDTVEMEEGRSISEIFESEGEGGFRVLELDYLQRILGDYRDFPTDMIIALGGGTLTTPACVKLLKEECTTVYLRASESQLVENLQIVGIENRPLFSGVDLDDKAAMLRKVHFLMEQRGGIYEKTADIIIDTDGLSFEQIAQRVADALSL